MVMAGFESFQLLVTFSLIPASFGVYPCTDYRFISMANGFRSSDYYSTDTLVPNCDAYLDPSDAWYRFEHDAGNRLIEQPVPPWHCGTQSPIWINGTHPTNESETSVVACATFNAKKECGWNGTVRIRQCNESGSAFFVYLLAVPPGCPLAYCIDGASRKKCLPPLVWLPDKFQCGPNVTGISTTTTTTTPTTATTQTPGPGWSSWGPRSVCSKQCDYGVQTRRRTCGSLPCDGEATDYQPCNKYNCQKLPEERDKGIVLVLKSTNSQEDTLLKVVLNEQPIQDILRNSINKICSQDVQQCCGGTTITGSSTADVEFVTADDIYPAQGRLEPKSGDTVYYQVIAIVNEYVDQRICKNNSRRIQTRQVVTQNFVTFEVMAKATEDSTYRMQQVTGLIVLEYKNPKDLTDDSCACPVPSCVVPIIVCLFALVIAVMVIVRYKKTRPIYSSRVETPSPPHYEEIYGAEMTPVECPHTVKHFSQRIIYPPITTEIIVVEKISDVKDKIQDPN